MGAVSAECIETNLWKLTAVETGDYKFVSWNDGNTDEIRYVYLTGDTQFTATFTTNSVPTLQSGVPAAVEAKVTERTDYTLDLSTIFEDINRDSMTYQVSINDGDPVAVDADFRRDFPEPGEYVLVFTAHDGLGWSTDTYTVTVTVIESPTVTLYVDEGAEAVIRTRASVYDADGSQISTTGWNNYSVNTAIELDYPRLYNELSCYASSYDSDNYRFAGWYVGDVFIPDVDFEEAGSTTTQVTVNNQVYHASIQYRSTRYFLYLYNAGEQYEETVPSPTEITENMIIEPVFEKITADTETYTLTALSNNGEMGTAGATRLRGNTWLIEAEPTAASAIFEEWDDGSMSASRTITLSQDMTLSAYFTDRISFITSWNESANASVRVMLREATGEMLTTITDKEYAYPYTYDELHAKLAYYSSLSLPVDAYDTENYSFAGWSVNGQLIAKSAMEEAGGSEIELDLEEAYGIKAFASYRAGGSAQYLLYVNNIEGYGEGNKSFNPNSVGIKILTDVTIAPVFAAKTAETYTATAVSADTAMGGSGAECIAGNLWKLTATPGEGYEFDHWSDGSIYPTYTVVMEENAQYTAYFREKAASEFTPTVQTDPDTDLVWATATDLGGNQYKLEAAADTDYAFAYWECNGEEISTSQKCTVTLTEDTTYTAHFETIQVTLTGNNAGIYAAADTLYYNLAQNQYSGEGGADTDQHKDMLEMRDVVYYEDYLEPSCLASDTTAARYFENRYLVAKTEFSPVIEIESESIDAYDNVILWFGVTYPKAITKGVTVHVYAGSDTSGELIGTAQWTGMTIAPTNPGAGIVRVPVDSMPYTDSVTVELTVDGGDSAAKTYALAAAMTDTGLLTERGTAVSAVNQAYKTSLETGFSPFSSEYLMINDIHADGIEAIKDAETTAEISAAKEECLARMANAANRIFDTGVKVGIRMGYGFQVVTVPKEVNVSIVMCAALEQAWPGEWYLYVHPSQFGWWINWAGKDGTDDLEANGGIVYGPQEGGATYGIADSTGTLFFANGASNQKIWDGLTINWNIWHSEQPSVVIRGGLPWHHRLGSGKAAE